MKDSEYKNHRRFTLRCIGQGIVVVSLKLRSTMNNISNRARQITQKSGKTTTIRRGQVHQCHTVRQ